MCYNQGVILIWKGCFSMNETLKTLLERRSIRAYRPEPVREEDLNAILEAGLWAPSGFNRQSTVLVVLQDKAVLAELEKANAALMGSEDAAPFYGAPMAILVLADIKNDFSGRKRLEDKYSTRVYSLLKDEDIQLALRKTVLS